MPRRRFTSSGRSGCGSAIVSHELDHALNAVDDVRGLLVHVHLDQHVAGIQLPFDRHFLAVLDLDHFLRRHERLADRTLLGGPRVRFDLSLDQRAHLVLVPSRRLDRVPTMFHATQRPAKSDGIALIRIPCSTKSMIVMTQTERRARK